MSDGTERDLRPVQLFFVQAKDVRKNDFIMTNNFDVGTGPAGRYLESARVFDCVRDIVQTNHEQYVKIVGAYDHIHHMDEWLIVALYAGG